MTSEYGESPAAKALPDARLLADLESANETLRKRSLIVDAELMERLRENVEKTCGMSKELQEVTLASSIAQLRLIEHSCHEALKPYLGSVHEHDAERYQQMVHALAQQCISRGIAPPTVRFHVTKTNRSRSWKQNVKKGQEAERQAKRWPTWHRRYKKWMRVAAKCGVCVWGESTVTPTAPLNVIELSFTLDANGVTFDTPEKT
ncbi:MAG: hypothetical protein WC869_01345 [Phycisphaerae bacterium]